MDPCLGIFCQKPTHLGGTPPYSVSMGVPPPRIIIYLGHVVGQDKCKVRLKFEASEKFPTPKTTVTEETASNFFRYGWILQKVLSQLFR